MDEILELEEQKKKAAEQASVTGDWSEYDGIAIKILKINEEKLKSN